MATKEPPSVFKNPESGVAPIIIILFLFVAVLIPITLLAATSNNSMDERSRASEPPTPRPTTPIPQRTLEKLCKLIDVPKSGTTIKPIKLTNNVPVNLNVQSVTVDFGDETGEPFPEQTITHLYTTPKTYIITVSLHFETTQIKDCTYEVIID